MASKELVAMFDQIALSATDADIDRYRGAYPNPAGGQKVLYRNTVEKARYMYASEMMKARAEVLNASPLGEQSE